MIIMSKYNPLWKWINKNKTDDFKLTFAEIENILKKSKRRLKHGIKEIELVVASSIGADLAMAFLT